MYFLVQLHNENKKDIALKSILEELSYISSQDKDLISSMPTLIKNDLYVIYSAESPIGFVSIKKNNDFTAEIYSIVLKDKYRGIGIGKKMLLNIETSLKSLGFKFLTIKTIDSPSKKSLLEYFESLSFYNLDSQKSELIESCNVITLLKTL